jgi:hypothetical protein
MTVLVTPEENEQYRIFISAVAHEAGVFDFPAEQVIWHYTNSDGLLGILHSATLFATQVAFLNDDRETRFGTDLFKIVVQEEIEERAEDADAVAFFKKVLELSTDDPTSPTHGISKFFITSFSADEDSGDQWQKYGGPHGYAIGFYARGLRREPNSQIYRVAYDPQKQVQAVKKIVRGTLDFYRRGFNEERSRDPSQWAIDFYQAWDEWIYKLAPLVKDRGQWSTENEFRLVTNSRFQSFHVFDLCRRVPRLLVIYRLTHRVG